MRPESLENVPAHARAGLMAMNAHSPLAQEGALDAVLARYDSGESIAEIAEDLGIATNSVYRQLLRSKPQEWCEYQAAQALAEREEAKRDLKAASDGVHVSRARELGRFSEWTLERTARAIYGDKLSVEVSATVDLGPLLGDALKLLDRRKERVIEPESVVAEQQNTEIV